MEPVTKVTPGLATPSPTAVRAQAPAPAIQVTAEQGDKRQAVTEQKLQRAIDQANRALAGTNHSIGFTYERRLNQLFVQVKDKATGEVIKEFPPKALIEHQAAMREFIGLMLDQKI